MTCNPYVLTLWLSVAVFVTMIHAGVVTNTATDSQRFNKMTWWQSINKEKLVSWQRG